MRKVALAFIIALSVTACSSSSMKLTEPPKDAAVWDLNVGRWPGTNDLIHEPTIQASDR